MSTTMQEDMLNMLERHGVPRDGVLSVEMGQYGVVVERFTGYDARGEPHYVMHTIPLNHRAPGVQGRLPFVLPPYGAGTGRLERAW